MSAKTAPWYFLRFCLLLYHIMTQCCVIMLFLVQSAYYPLPLRIFEAYTSEVMHLLAKNLILILCQLIYILWTLIVHTTVPSLAWSTNPAEGNLLRVLSGFSCIYMHRHMFICISSLYVYLLWWTVYTHKLCWPQSTQPNIMLLGRTRMEHHQNLLYYLTTVCVCVCVFKRNPNSFFTRVGVMKRKALWYLFFL